MSNDTPRDVNIPTLTIIGMDGQEGGWPAESRPFR